MNLFWIVVPLLQQALILGLEILKPFKLEPLLPDSFACLFKLVSQPLIANNQLPALFLKHRPVRIDGRELLIMPLERCGSGGLFLLERPKTVVFASAQHQGEQHDKSRPRACESYNVPSHNAILPPEAGNSKHRVRAVGQLPFDA